MKTFKVGDNVIVIVRPFVIRGRPPLSGTIVSLPKDAHKPTFPYNNYRVKILYDDTSYEVWAGDSELEIDAQWVRDNKLNELGI